MLPDALQEVLEVGHGGLHDALPQLGDVLGHVLTEPIALDPGELGMLQLLQRLQRIVVSGRRQAIHNRYINGPLV